jgi:hypothetical protein
VQKSESIVNADVSNRCNAVLRYNNGYNKTSISLLFYALFCICIFYKVNKYSALGANRRVGRKVVDNLYIASNVYIFFKIQYLINKFFLNIFVYQTIQWTCYFICCHFCDVCVYSCCFYAGMPQKLLNVANIGSAFQ